MDDMPISPEAEKNRHGGLTEFGKVITANNNRFWKEIMTAAFLNVVPINIMNLKEL
jgi:hypothetical protein